MKKSLAVFGASAMGLGLVGAGAVAPAAAAGPIEACADMSAQLAATGNVTENWYQDCVPQYGLGKAEFSIVADEDDPTAEFPAGFVPLNELPADSVSSTSDLATLQDYFDGAEIGTPFGAPVSALDSDLSDPTTHRYFASVVAPISEIGELNLEGGVPADIAAECLVADTPYAGGWFARFDELNTTYSQVVDGEDWNYTIAATPRPTYFFGTADDSFEPWCATDGTTTLLSSSFNNPMNQSDVFGYVFTTLMDFEALQEDDFLMSLGSFARDVPFVPEPEVPEPEVPNPEVPEPEVPTPEVPTPEVPTPEVPTPEVPTPEVPTPEVPTPEVPTPEVPTPERPATAPPAVAAPAAPVTRSELASTGAHVAPLAIAAGAFTLIGFALLGFVNFVGRRRPRV